MKVFFNYFAFILIVMMVYSCNSKSNPQTRNFVIEYGNLEESYIDKHDFIKNSLIDSLNSWNPQKQIPRLLIEPNLDCILRNHSYNLSSNPLKKSVRMEILESISNKKVLEAIVSANIYEKQFTKLKQDTLVISYFKIDSLSDDVQISFDFDSLHDTIFQGMCNAYEYSDLPLNKLANLVLEKHNKKVWDDSF